MVMFLAAGAVPFGARACIDASQSRISSEQQVSDDSILDLPPVRLVRDIGMAAVNRIGPLRRAFMREAGGATGDLPKLLRGELV